MTSETTVSCPAHTHLLVRNALMSNVEILRLILAKTNEISRLHSTSPTIVKVFYLCLGIRTFF